MRLLQICIVFLTTGCLLSCKKDDVSTLSTPSNVSNVTVEPRVGGAMLRFQVPADSNYSYLEVSYNRAGKKRIINVSKFTDSLLVTGLLNNQEYTFDIQSVNRDAGNIVSGSMLQSGLVRPIRRPNQVTYLSDQLTKIAVDAQMLETYTQETSEGPKVNLVDGSITTYWHSAWSAGVAPLPHWIKISFTEPTDLGLIKYHFRQNSSDVNGRPSQWALEVSEDNTTWSRVWTSQDGLPTDAPTTEKVVAFDKNYKSRYFRLMIIKAGGSATRNYAHLGEISFYRMGTEVTDMEKVAEDNYENPWL